LLVTIGRCGSFWLEIGERCGDAVGDHVDVVGDRVDVVMNRVDADLLTDYDEPVTGHDELVMTPDHAGTGHDARANDQSDSRT
jgi:hypothetical protein